MITPSPDDADTRPVPDRDPGSDSAADRPRESNPDPSPGDQPDRGAPAVDPDSAARDAALLLDRLAAGESLGADAWAQLQDLPPATLGESLSLARERARGAAPPTTIEGFEITHELGRGGMGVVYEATQVDLGRRVALKVLPPLGRDGVAQRRFEREARAVADLSHPTFAPSTPRG